MGGESFPSQKLIQLSDKIGSGATPRGGSSVYLESGEISLIRSQNILNNEFSVSGLVYIEPEAAEKLSNVVVQEDDVLLNITGDSVARCCQVNPKVLPARVNQHVAIIRPKKEILDPKYLRYFLVSPSMQNYMLGLAGAGATRNALTKGMIEDFDIPLPSIEVQESIAHILGTLDDKIELNRQMNATLEAMAQALFKSWFVDFDPVIDNALAAGNPIPEPLQARAEVRKALGDKRKPLPEEIQKQFPSNFVFSEEMGWVPEGWDMCSLEDLCEKITDGSHQSPKSVDENAGLPMASSKDITKNGIDYGTSRYISEEDFSELVNNGCSPNVGDVLIAKDGSRCGETCCIHNSEEPVVLLSSVAILRPRKLSYSTYINTLLSRPETIKNLRENYVSGSAIPRIVLRDFKRYPVIKPLDSIFDHWNTFSEALHHRSVELNLESNSLAAIRNTLLPKLLSGQLRIPDAEKQLAEAI